MDTTFGTGTRRKRAMRLTPIETTTTMATSVSDLTSACAFVMEHLDALGDSPQITIVPVWTYTVGDDEQSGKQVFEVSVSGLKEQM